MSAPLPCGISLFHKVPKLMLISYQYLGLQVILWGICVTMTCACKNYASLVAVRVLLGCFESAVAPSLILVTGMWYKKNEQPTRIGIWYLGTGTGTIIGAVSSYGFQHYTGASFKSWQIMFLVFGLITIAVGICVILFLPDNPMSSRLSHEEKIFAIERLRENKTGIENKTFKWSQALECLKDPHTWMLSLITVSSNVTNGAVSSFQATIIKGQVFRTV
jgi:sugar phosphate permease